MKRILDAFNGHNPSGVCWPLVAVFLSFLCTLVPRLHVALLGVIIAVLRIVLLLRGRHLAACHHALYLRPSFPNIAHWPVWSLPHPVPDVNVQAIRATRFMNGNPFLFFLPFLCTLLHSGRAVFLDRTLASWRSSQLHLKQSFPYIASRPSWPLSHPVPAATVQVQTILNRAESFVECASEISPRPIPRLDNQH